MAPHRGGKKQRDDDKQQEAEAPAQGSGPDDATAGRVVQTCATYNWSKLRDEVVNVFAPYLALDERRDRDNRERGKGGDRSKDRSRRPPERCCEGASIYDVVHEVIADLYEQRKGCLEEPINHEHLRLQAVALVKQLLATDRKRERERERCLERFALNVVPSDLLDAVIAKDKFEAFLRDLYRSFDQDRQAAKLLYASIDFDIPFHRTDEFAVILKCSEDDVTNLKRKIIRVATRIMQDLTQDAPGSQS